MASIAGKFSTLPGFAGATSYNKLHINVEHL